jgi:DNA-binding MarR family transcriptional regulator
MKSSNDYQKQVVIATQEFGIASVLFRNAIGKQLGLNITDIGCLNYLFIKGATTPTELAYYSGLTTGSATAMIDRLEKLKLINRKANPNDRRSLIIDVNQSVREKIGPLVAGAQKAQLKLLANYTNEELAAIADFLTKFTTNVKDNTTTILQVNNKIR